MALSRNAIIAASVIDPVVIAYSSAKSSGQLLFSPPPISTMGTSQL
jgi:hypothetical protein